MNDAAADDDEARGGSRGRRAGEGPSGDVAGAEADAAALLERVAAAAGGATARIPSRRLCRRLCSPEPQSWSGACAGSGASAARTGTSTGPRRGRSGRRR